MISNGEYASAIPFLNASLEKFEEIGDQENVAYLYSSLGYAHLSAYETNKAISFYLKGLKIFKDMDNQKGVSEKYISPQQLISPASSENGCITSCDYDRIATITEINDSNNNRIAIYPDRFL